MHVHSSRLLFILMSFNISDTRTFPGKIDVSEMRIELTLIKCSDEFHEPMMPMTLPELKAV